MILNPNNENAGHEFDIKDFEEVKWHKMAIETIKSFEIEKVQAFQKILLKFPSGLGENIDASEIIHTQEHFPLKSIKRGASSRWSSSLYCPRRNLDEMTIGQAHPTLFLPGSENDQVGTS